MPRIPITGREVFYAEAKDKSLYLLPFTLVNTSLGGMVEPSSITQITTDMSATNVPDVAANTISVIDPNTIFDLLGTSGLGWPIDFATY